MFICGVQKVGVLNMGVSSSPFSLESRCDKEMDALSGYALCLPNLTRMHFVEHRPKLCIEIKVST